MAARKRRGRRRSVFPVLLLAVIIIAGAAAGLWYKSTRDYNEAFSSDTTEVHITVPSGSSTKAIANLLESNGLIKSANTFVYKSRFLGYDGKYQAGEFDLSPSMTMEEIMEALQNAKRETFSFTIPEGYNIRQIGDRLEAEGIVTAEEFFAALENGKYDYWFVKDLKAQYTDGTGRVSAEANKYEGFLFPDTYQFYVGSSAEAIVNKLLGQFDKVYDEELQARAKELGLTTNEVITIASLIERETKTDSERPTVASVIYNRLDINMKLQFCSTVQYALGEQKARLLIRDTKIDSPYNTYIIDGLPPAPIASPGKACIRAALYPDDTDYLFFVLKADGSGTHNFSSDGSKFAKDKQEYIDALP